MALVERALTRMVQAGQKPLLRGAVYRENDNYGETARSEKILLWGIMPPLLSDGEGRDGGGMVGGWIVEGWTDG